MAIWMTIAIRISIGFGIGLLCGFLIHLIMFGLSKLIGPTDSLIIVKNWSVLGLTCGALSGGLVAFRNGEDVVNGVSIGVLLGLVMGFAVGIIMKKPIHECRLFCGPVIGAFIGVLISFMGLGFGDLI